MNRIRKNTPLIILAGLCLLALLIAGISYSSAKRAANALELSETNQIYDLRNQLAAKQNSVDSSNVEIIRAKTDLDETRIINDEATVKEFLQKAFTWSNGAEYDAVRASFINDYGIEESSYFLTTFYPENVRIEWTDENGAVVEGNWIDHHNMKYKYNDDGSVASAEFYSMNMAYSSSDIYLTSVNGDTYSYYVIVDVMSVDATGYEAISNDICAIFLDTLSDGTITNIVPYVMP